MGVINGASDGTLTVKEALDIARESNGQPLDAEVTAVLEEAITAIWNRVRAQPDTYIFSVEEFAVFNFFRDRFRNDVAGTRAVARYWNNHRVQSSSATSNYSAQPSQRPRKEEASTVPMETSKLRWSSNGPNLKRGAALPQAFLPEHTESSTNEQTINSLDSSNFEKPDYKLQKLIDLTPSMISSNIKGTIQLKSLIRLFSVLALGFILLRTFTTPSWKTDIRESPSRPRHTKYDTASSIPLLQVFEVYQPVLTPHGSSGQEILTNGSTSGGIPAGFSNASSCLYTETLMEYSFAYSYGQPYVGTYSPPPCNFSRVTINFTVTSSGRQFDRLALMYLGDTEVFRTSTAEPTATGISWTYIKDMSNYLALFKESQKIIFDLGNLIDSTYTGAFNTTLTATFFTDADTITPADAIIPISARRSSSDAASAFALPADNASSIVSLPRNAQRAVFTISACGQANEEFWYTNVLSSDVLTFGSAAGLLGYSPFRELQLYIDGILAGVEWPFPVIFTGGIAPGFWRPIVGIGAFDLKEHEIDITPWLPLLSDGNNHTFEIRVAGLNDDGKGHAALSETVGSNWVVTGKIFLWLDEAGSVTTGSVPLVETPAPSISVSSSLGINATGGNQSLTYNVSASRRLSISSTVITSAGRRTASWSQTLDYSNSGFFTQQGNYQANNQSTTGVDASASGYSRTYRYPIDVVEVYATDPASGNFTIDANITRGLDLQAFGDAVFPTGLQYFGTLPSTRSLFSSLAGSGLHTTQNGSAHYLSVPAISKSFSSGTTEQDFSFQGFQTSSSDIGQPPSIQGTYELYHRYVLATNGTLVKDQESLAGSTIGDYTFPVSQVGGGWLSQDYAGLSVKEVLGRGPGASKPNLVSSGGGR
ncbi:MAG: hypothetical protein M1819_001989 [Sarea resinae]|nr:MAG: hypothetical protein M1819_001989 [Sarea resinae]